MTRKFLFYVDRREKPRWLRRLVFVKIFFYKFYCKKVESETVAKNYGMSIKKSPSVVFRDCWEQCELYDDDDWWPEIETRWQIWSKCWVNASWIVLPNDSNSSFTLLAVTLPTGRIQRFFHCNTCDMTWALTKLHEDTTRRVLRSNIGGFCIFWFICFYTSV